METNTPFLSKKLIDRVDGCAATHTIDRTPICYAPILSGDSYPATQRIKHPFSQVTQHDFLLSGYFAGWRCI